MGRDRQKDKARARLPQNRGTVNKGRGRGRIAHGSILERHNASKLQAKKKIKGQVAASSGGGRQNRRWSGMVEPRPGVASGKRLQLRRASQVCPRRAKPRC
jgi:hypothetical protein